MKTFKRTSLPSEIKYNNKTFIRGEKTENSICVEVLSTRLKNVLDYHNKPYKPTIHFFNPI